MSGQRGRDVLLKLSDGGDPAAFVTVAGVRAKTLDLGASAVDGTSADSPAGWRELVAGAGVKSARIRGSGVFKDAGSDARMRALFFAGEIADWQVIVPDFGAFTGPFQITDLTWSGEHDGEAAFSLSIESAGALTFEAAP